MSVEVEQLIEEVSLRPSIWDHNCPEYQILRERNNAWEEICDVLFDDYQEKDAERKSELCRLLQRKWKSLRDCYVREHNNNTQKNGKFYRRRYVFSRALSFLEPTLKRKSKADEEEIDPLREDPINSHEHTDTPNKPESLAEKGSAIKRQSDSRISNNEKKLKREKFKEKTAHNEPIIDHDDEDRLFLLSLVSDLKKVSEDNRLEAKSEILLVLNKWKKPTWDELQMILDDKVAAV